MSSRHVWTAEELVEADESERKLKFVFFWGHAAPGDGRIGAHVLSQWSPHSFAIDGIEYPTAEHFMMAEKARLFGDEARLEEILAASSPGAAKAAGRNVSGFDDAVWCEHRFDIVVRGNVAKFGSDGELGRFLVGTGDRVLVEASPLDRVWGIGMDQNDPDASHPARWRGLNLLGFALMHARAELAGDSP